MEQKNQEQSHIRKQARHGLLPDTQCMDQKHLDGNCTLASLLTAGVAPCELGTGGVRFIHLPHQRGWLAPAVGQRCHAHE